MTIPYITAANRKPAYVLFFITFLFACQFTFAQEATPTPTEEQIRQRILDNAAAQKAVADANKATADAQKAAADAEKATLDAEKAKKDAEFPKPSATPLEGKTELEGVKIESEMMAYRALSNAALLVADDVDKNIKIQCQIESLIKDCSNTKVAILNNQWLTGMRGYWGTMNQLQLLQRNYDGIFKPQIPSQIIGLSNLLNNGMVADLYRAANKAKADEEKKGGIFFKMQTVKPNEKGLPDELIAIEKLGDTSAGGAFKSGLSTAINSTGMIGSAIGAVIDVLALMRTDTKITGATYTVQESAFVSQVYRNLNKPKSGGNILFYPKEFSPNLNLQKPEGFVILEQLQQVSELKAKGEQIVAGIEENDAAYKDAVAAKEALEERQKALPDELNAVKNKIKALETAFPNPKKRSREVINDLQDLDAKQKALQKEFDGLPDKISKKDAAAKTLAAKRDSFYNQINAVIPQKEVIEGFVKIGYQLDDNGRQILNRVYTFEEIEGLAANRDNIKQKLIAEAKNRLRNSYTPAVEKKLLNPYEPERLKIFVKIAHSIISDPKPLNQLQPANFLSPVEQLKMILPQDEDVNVELKILNRTKDAAVSKLKILNAQFGKLMDDLVKVDSTTGLSPIALNLQTENMMDALGCNFSTGRCDNAYALTLNVIEAGGNNRTKKNLLTMMATGDNVTHSGGAIVEYRLYDMNGEIKTSSICRAYERYRKPSNINKNKPGEKANAFCESLPSEEITTRPRDL